ncbi:MAG TPA: PxKF domain-containing protein [Candidatus Paceibacterota bacterium]
MKIKTAYLGLPILVGALLFSGIALAHPPTIAIDAIPDMEFESFPESYTVTGTVTHASATGPGEINVCRLTVLKVTVSDGVNPSVTILDDATPKTTFGWSPSCAVSDDWSTNWDITAPGTYTLTATIKHVGATGSDEEVSVITEEVVIVDTTAPVIVPTVLPDANANGWNNTDVEISWDVTDPDSDILSTEGCETVVLTDETAGTTITCTATSEGGTSEESVTIMIDKTAPTISGSRTPAPNANGWNNTDVVVDFSCEDALSGVGTNTVAGGTVSTDGAGQSVTNSGECVDIAGNSAANATVSDINIDRTAPVIVITTPGDESMFSFKEVVNAFWSATDALSGVDTAIGTTASGDPIDTNPIGAYTYTVSATDLAGNMSLLTNDYTVVPYSFGNFLAPLNLAKKDFNKLSTIPVKFQLFGLGGGFIPDAIAQLWVDGVPAVSSGSANAENYFRYDRAVNQYIFNLSTKMPVLTLGTHTLRVTLDDGSSHEITVRIK